MKKKHSLLKQFYENLRHPRKSSLFRFQRIGYNISYAFFLTLIAAVFFSPTVIKATIKVGQSFSYICLPFGLIYYYIVLTFLFFTYISILSIGTFGITKALKKRVNGQQAWSLTVNACTWPTLLFSFVSLFLRLPPGSFFVYFVLTLIMLFNMAVAIPKPKTRPANPRQVKSS